MRIKLFESFKDGVYKDGILDNSDNKNGYYEFYKDGILKARGNYYNNVCSGYWEYPMDKSDRYSTIIYFSNIDDLKRPWIKFNLSEINRVSKYVNLVNKKNRYDYYLIDDKCNFIIKLEDDYYYICYNGVYKKCDQLSELIKELKKTKIFESVEGINKYNSSGQREGYWEIYNSSNKLILKCNYKNGLLDGPFESYYDNGYIKYNGNYKNDLLDGYLEEYYINGNINSKGNYKNGNQDGYWEDYYNNGNIHKKCYYKNGLLDGPFESYYDNGYIKYKGNYLLNRKDGYCKEYLRDGKLVDGVNYKNGSKIGFNVYLDDSVYKKVFYYYHNEELDFKYLKLSNQEYNKINNLFPLEEVYIDDNDLMNYNNYYYIFGNKLSFIGKLDDDYFHLFHDSKYTKYDQLYDLFKELKKIKYNDN